MELVERTRTSKLLDLLFVVVGAPLWIPAFLVVAGAYYFGYLLPLRLRVERTWVTKGRRILLVYSRNPLWQSYIESNWLPRLGEQAVLFNWSDRRELKHVKSFEARVSQYWLDGGVDIPIVLMFSGIVRTRHIGLREAFCALEQGKPDKLHAAESEMFAFVERTRRPRA